MPEPGEEQMVEALRRWKDDQQVAASILQAVELPDYEFKQSELIEEGSRTKSNPSLN